MFYLLETGVGAGSRTFTQAPTGSGSATLLPPPPNDNSETARLALHASTIYVFLILFFLSVLIRCCPRDK